MAAISEREMQDTRHRILRLLKLKGPLSADEMSQELKITYMGVRQHLTPLEHDGLIRHHREQRGIGRPTYVYSLTELGHNTATPRSPRLDAETPGLQQRRIRKINRP